MDKEGVKENGPPQVGEGHDMYMYCFISMKSIKCDQYLLAMEERESERERGLSYLEMSMLKHFYV